MPRKSPAPAADPAPETVLIDGAEYLPLTDFSAWFTSQQSARVGGGLELKLGIPLESRSDVFTLMDTAGEMLHCVVFRRVIDTYELDGDGEPA